VADGTRDNIHELWVGSFRLNIRRNSTRSMVQHWSRVPMDDVDTLGSFQDLLHKPTADITQCWGQ